MTMNRLLHGIPLTLLAGILLVPGIAFSAAKPPAPPGKMVSPLPPDSGGGRTIPVRAGDNLQAKLDDAKPGDTLVLDAGATWIGNFTLPAKSGAGWITIRSSQESKLPGPGQRVSPAAAPAMPKILTPNGTGAINASDGSHGWRLVGLEVSVVPTWQSTVYQLLSIGSGSADWGKRRPTDVVTSRIIVERCYIHGSPTQKVRRGILANAKDMRIADSWIDDRTPLVSEEDRAWLRQRYEERAAFGSARGSTDPTTQKPSSRGTTSGSRTSILTLRGAPSSCSPT